MIPIPTPRDFEEASVLRAILEGTATATGDEFFRALVAELAKTLSAACVFVSEFVEGSGKRQVRTLAFCSNGRIEDNFEFDLDGTPCEPVLSGSFSHHPTGIQQLYPRDKGLATLHLESYMGVPLLSEAGEVLGHLAIFDTRPMPPEPRFLSVVRIFAGRARAELERKRAEILLRESQERLARILESAMDAIVTVDMERNIALFNRSAEKAFRCSRDQAIGKPLDRFLSQNSRAFLEGRFRDRPPEESCVWLPDGLTARRADGVEFPIEGTLSKVRIEGEDFHTLILRDINERKQAEAELSKLKMEKDYLQEEIRGQYNFEEIVGQSSALRSVLETVELVAATDSTVLIQGETGTGKELIARAIHNLSPRRGRALIKVNCGGVPANLLESEFFGHERGAFTGAVSQRLGRFELADGGTLFLDEVGEIPLEAQAKLLRVLQEREFERVGGSKTFKVDVRVIAATNRDLLKEAAEGRFRDDLFYRLSVFPIRLPPLRERKEDIPSLVKHFMEKHARRIGRRTSRLSDAILQGILEYPWPGNIRELENAVERAVILSTGEELRLDLPPVSRPPGPAATVLESTESSLIDVERRHILEVLHRTNWVIEGARGAAKVLDLHPNTLRSRIQKLGIQRPGAA
ncbi:MAG: sigma 54-interacting transcriptional regulator [Candidatus Omnitrophica bacterium]|nr:sigma 54-interacting transcriptional regulator [Candidatus Omnitrophota bacterium]